ncbi:aspartate kinase [Lentibacillus amyloliquefaciens]|uniref:Aspartokinase n=1 Tax=Lentibacillus amyloliquefaciens TaxID=1472767 RepID=A0A0U4F5H0_9BACI|nr:aspartate kinase [Lentibacillus amyloliquefaciens]ALX48035.1 aspartate kinase [Lentibacillus amyloliquefaciens]
MKVAKFGGSSVASSEQIKKVGSIIADDPDRKFVVVSAPGKRFSDDVKITDLLIELDELAGESKDYQYKITEIMKRFSEIVEELKVSKTVLDDIENTIYSTLNSEWTGQMKTDGLKSIGEDSSAKIVSEYLKTQGLNAQYLNPKDAGIIVSNEPGNAQVLQESYAKLYNMREKDGVCVIPGFFGYTNDSQLMTFPRGGSDITGSIVAAGVRADLYENFTDVDSVYVVDPRVIENPEEVTKLTYKEMRELSYSGFGVFHDEALMPAFQAEIPVCIKNTNNPANSGTMIVSEKDPKTRCVVGIAADTGFSNLYVSKYLMNRELGFGRRLLQILEEEGISFEHAPSGIDNMSVIIRDNQLNAEKELNVINRIKSELKPETISIDYGFAMIMVVGEGMMNAVGIAEKSTAAFAEANISIEMINQGSSEVSVMFGIRKDKLNLAIKALYNKFFQ